MSASSLAASATNLAVMVMVAQPGTDLICMIIQQTKAPALSGAFLFIEFRRGRVIVDF
jgi:hypothetical protein